MPSFKDKQIGKGSGTPSRKNSIQVSVKKNFVQNCPKNNAFFGWLTLNVTQIQTPESVTRPCSSALGLIMRGVNEVTQLSHVNNSPL